MDLKEFQSLVPQGTDIRPLLPRVVRLYTQGNERAHKSLYGRDGHVITEAEKACGFWKPDHRVVEGKRRTSDDEIARDYSKIVDAWKRKDKSKRGDKNRAAAVFYWFFRFVPEPLYFFEIASSVWPSDSETFMRFAYAKAGGGIDDNFEAALERFRAPLSEVEEGCRELVETTPSLSAMKESGSASNPKLLRAWAASSKFHFTNAKSRLVGRAKELSRLEAMLDDEPGFQWMQISGPAGTGKSRLASELISKSKAHWLSGFFTSRNMREFSQYQESWQPTEPHLLVIDYVVSRLTEVSDFLQSLARNFSEFMVPVRVLIIERQPWKFKLEPKGGSTIFARYDQKFQDRMRANWFLDLHRERDSFDLSSDEYIFGDGLLELDELSAEQALQIVKDHCSERAVADFGQKAIQLYISKHGLEGRPLYLLFISDALKDGSFDKTWMRGDLLSNVLAREERNVWTAIPKPALPFDELRSQAIELSLVPTILGRVSSSELAKDWPTIFELRQQAVLAALQITGSEIWETGQIDSFAGMEPHLLGEWFSLQELSKHKNKDDIVKRVWTLGRNSTRAFLRRTIEDFPQHPSVNLFFDYIPEGLVYTDLLEEISLEVFQDCIDADMPICLSAYHTLAKSYRSECVLACAYCRLNAVRIFSGEIHGAGQKVLRASRVSSDPISRFAEGFMLERGWGVEQDVSRAFECYSDAACNGHPLSAICQHFALHNFRMKYELAGDSDALLAQGVKGIRAIVDEMAELSGVRGDNMMAAQRRTVAEYSSSFLSDASNFFAVMASNNQRHGDFSNQFFENAQVFGQMASLLRHDPHGDLNGEKYIDLAG